jgi:hypothetical protein
MSARHSLAVIAWTICCLSSRQNPRSNHGRTCVAFPDVGCVAVTERSTGPVGTLPELPGNAIRILPDVLCRVGMDVRRSAVGSAQTNSLGLITP